jgi:hypothetical protein
MHEEITSHVSAALAHVDAVEDDQAVVQALSDALAAFEAFFRRHLEPRLQGGAEYRRGRDVLWTLVMRWPALTAEQRRAFLDEVLELLAADAAAEPGRAERARNARAT